MSGVDKKHCMFLHGFDTRLVNIKVAGMQIIDFQSPKIQYGSRPGLHACGEYFPGHRILFATKHCRWVHLFLVQN